MGGRLPQCTPKEVIRALEKLGFIFVRQRGSHVVFKHPTTNHRTVVPLHSGDINRPLLFGIIDQSGFSVEDFLKALE